MTYYSGNTELTRKKLRVVLVKPWRVMFCDSCSATPGSCNERGQHRHSCIFNYALTYIGLTWHIWIHNCKQLTNRLIMVFRNHLLTATYAMWCWSGGRRRVVQLSLCITAL